MSYSISEITELWQKALKIIEKKLDDKAPFDDFFSNTYIDSISDGKVTLVGHSALSVRLLSSTYKSLILDTLRSLTGESFELVVITKKKEAAKPSFSQNKQSEKEPTFFKDATLNKNLTFDNFIVGDFNKMTARAAKIVAEKPGLRFNPLFIHSHSGLGKTHLLHAIGNYVVEHSAERAKVLYMHANLFVDEYIKFVTGDKTQSSLRDELSSADLLLFDDVQLLAEKVKSQEMFFTIYESLVNKGKQIVIASDRHPDELKGLEERLVTRFSQGLITEIQEPDVETCIEILKSRISMSGLGVDRFDNDVLKFFASKYSSNIRKLEGALNGLILSAELLAEDERITMDVAIKSTSNYIQNKNLSSQLTEQKIINAVSDYYKIPVTSIVGESREASIARARHVAIYLIYTTLKDLPLKRIGSIFGGKDHSTIKYSVDKISKELKTNENLGKSINKIKESLNKK